MSSYKELKAAHGSLMTEACAVKLWQSNYFVPYTLRVILFYQIHIAGDKKRVCMIQQSVTPPFYSVIWIFFSTVLFS